MVSIKVPITTIFEWIRDKGKPGRSKLLWEELWLFVSDNIGNLADIKSSWIGSPDKRADNGKGEGKNWKCDSPILFWGAHMNVLLSIMLDWLINTY